MSQQTQVNGNRYSFTNVFVTLAGVPQYPVFKSINYDATQEPGTVQGNQVTIVGRTQGYGTGTGSFEMLLSECMDFFAIITGDGAFPIMGCPDFNITISYSTNGIDTITDELIGCRITKVGAANAQGAEASTRTCDLSIARVMHDGLDAFGDGASF